MNITILGAHNSESSYTRCTSILIDEKIAIDAGGLTSALSDKAQHDIQALLVTHHHYDHVRDIPTLAMNFDMHMRFYHGTEQLNLYTTETVREALMSNLLDGKLYPDFTRRPKDLPALRFIIIEPGKNVDIAGYEVLPVSVNHAIPSVGFQITDASNTTIFYTGDTGTGLSESWPKIGKPRLIITETTLNNEHQEEAKAPVHMTPNLLKQELILFRETKGYLPRVLVLHMTPILENDIKFEIENVAKDLGATIELTYEGMQVNV